MSAQTTAEVTIENTARSVKTKTWNIHYYEAGTGYPVIMLHGSGPGATGWSNFSKSLAALSDRFRVLAVDMPGWGKSDAVTWEERNHPQALLEFMEALGIEKAAVVGNSMGGMTGLRFTVDHPDRISHLITLGSPSGGPGLFQPSGISEGGKVLRAAYYTPTPQGMSDLVNVMTSKQGFATPELMEPRAAAASERQDHLENYIAGLAHPAVAMGPDIWARLSETEVPTLLIHGRDDRVVHFENSLRLVQLIPDSRMVLINQVGHWVQNEVSDEFNRLVANFVEHH